MSDPAQPPPPKPKPGSLRDRIAAFEKKPASPSASPSPSAAPPPVRPKPGNVSWKPTPPSPTAPAGATTADSNEERKRSGMSASDAKESIGKGGSLKERMAALQGKGAFGGGGAPSPPPPVGPKPAKRPPLVVSPPPVEESEEKEKELGASEEHAEERKVDTEASVESAATPQEDKEESAEEEEQDEEAKERERRAALAARMARLGGARVGMGPPVFAKKPEVKPKPKEVPEQKEEQKETSTPVTEDKTAEPVRKDSKEASFTPVEAPVPPTEETATSPEVKQASSEVPHIVTDEETISKDSAAQAVSPPSSTSDSRAALGSSSSQSSLTPSRSPPTSMPMPAAPRRAGPPRSRSARNIKAQAAKQDQEAAQAPPPPPETHEEPAAAPVAPSESKPEPPAPAKEENAEQEPELAHERAVPDPIASAPPEHQLVPAASHNLEEDVAPPSVQLEQEKESVPEVPESSGEEAIEVPKSPEEKEPVHGVHEEPNHEQATETVAGVPAVLPGIILPPPESTTKADTAHVDEHAPGPVYDTAETKDAEDPINLTAAEPQTHELPEPKVSPSAEQFSHADAPAAERDLASTAEAEDTIKPSAGEARPSPPASEPEPEVAAIQEPEQPKASAAEDETEDDEAARRKRIAERMAKMGGRNPFAASPFGAAPPRKVSTDEAQEPTSVSQPQEYSTADKDIGDIDVVPEHEDIAETGVASESHEVQDPGPRVSGVAEEQDDEVPEVEESLEEHEATEPEHKTASQLLSSSGPEDPTEPVSPVEESHYPEEVDEMAPPRITRAVPPPPPEASPEEPAVSPIIKRASQRRSIPRPPPEPTSPVRTDTAEHGEEEEEEEEGMVEEQDITPRVDAAPPARDLIPKPSPERPKETEKTPPRTSPTSRRSMPPPPRAVPVVPPSAESTRAQSPTLESPRRSIPPHPRTASIPSHEEDPTEVQSPVSPASSRRAVSPPARAPPVSPPPRSASPEASIVSPVGSMRRSIPPPRRTPSVRAEEPLSPPPRRAPSPQVEESAPPPSDPPEEAPPPPPRRAPSQSAEPAVPPPPRRASSQYAEDTVVNRDSMDEQEVLTDSEADPIDPSFHSPPRSPLQSPRDQQPPSFTSGSRMASGDIVEEDTEQVRRRTIAERMAKLGGIKFGAPPPVPRKPAAAPVEKPASEEVTEEHEIKEEEPEPEAPDAEAEQPDAEETERARRQAIATRLAGMGGMRFGMLPHTSASAHPRARSDDSAHSVEQPPPPPQRSQPPPPPPESEDVESEGRSVSDEGVKVEAGSEMSLEEIHAEDAEEDAEEIPPPVPSRPSRQSHAPTPEAAPPLPGGRRPPVPSSALPTRPPAPHTESKRSSIPTSFRKASGSSGAPTIPHSSDFVMVDDPAPEEEAPPPPPPRAVRPPRGVPPPAPSSAARHVSPTRDMANSQWELPDIPTGSFDLNVGGGLGMDASVTSEDSTTYPSAPSPPPPAPVARPTNLTPTPTSSSIGHADVQLSSDELLQLWGTVGTAVHAAASTLFDKSKKSLVGDGTSRGFVNAALAQVPNASKVSYGHLFYSQNAHTVLRRTSTIMPGDIVQLTEAKLKGHKGLQSYHQTAGTAQEPLVGIVSEFDGKKSKVKVYQANQHVGGQTVEMASYRLDDLKSGNVKVFRVASA